EFAGDARFADGTGEPLARPEIAIDGSPVDLGAGTLVWERALGWLPTFTGSLEKVVLRGTVFAPYGRDADTAGAVYALALENRANKEIEVRVALRGTLGYRQLRVRSARAFDDAHRIQRVGDDLIVLAGSALPGLVAVAIAAD